MLLIDLGGKEAPTVRSAPPALERITKTSRRSCALPGPSTAVLAVHALPAAPVPLGKGWRAAVLLASFLLLKAGLNSSAAIGAHL